MLNKKRLFLACILVVFMFLICLSGLIDKACAQGDAEDTGPAPEMASGTVTGIDATVIGTGEFAPGATSQLQVVVQNNNIIGKIHEAAVQGGISQMYGSAVALTALLERGNAPVTVKVAKILLGTLRAGEAVAPVTFLIEVNEDAKPGKYEMILILTYRMLVEVSKISGGTAGAELNWSDLAEAKGLAIEIKKPALEFEVADVKVQLVQGARKDIQVKFINSDIKVARDAEAELSAEGPISLIQNIAFLGTIGPDETAVGTFGFKVAGDAIPGEYAVNAVVKYRDENGNEYKTSKMKVPVRVNSGSSIAEFIGSNFVGIVIGFVLMGIIWFVWDVVITGKSEKKKS